MRYEPGARSDVLLDLDGQVLVIDAKREYWVRFSVQRVNCSFERPHGLNYSLTLHGPGGQRLVGFDNAHAVRVAGGPGGRKKGQADHQHRIDAVRPYRFVNAAKLLEDFWAAVDSYLKEKGVV
jgi:hypothetical protein